MRIFFVAVETAREQNEASTSRYMQDDQNVAAPSIFSDEKVLLWLAVGLAVVFLSLLVFDLVRRRKRARRHRRGEPESLRDKLRKPFESAKALRSDLARMLREYSRRKRRHGPRPPQGPP